MTENEVKQLLKKIGLDQVEIACYLELLKKSPQRASQLARKLDIPKATVLLNLSQLVDNFGLVKREKRQNYFLFLVEDAKDLIGYLEKKIENTQKTYEKVKNLLPELRALQQFGVEKPEILYFEGKEGLKRAFEMVLDEADEIFAYGNNEDEVIGMPDVFPDYYERRVDKKIPVIQALAPATPFNIEETLKNEHRHLRNTRFLPKENLFHIQFNLYKDTAIFYSFEEMFALVLRSRPIVGCLKMIFGLAFKQSESFDLELRKKLGKNPNF